jgi:hypothetical protein
MAVSISFSRTLRRFTKLQVYSLLHTALSTALNKRKVFSATQLQGYELVDLPTSQHTEMRISPPAELQDFLPADASGYPALDRSDFLSTEARTSVSMEMPDSLSVEISDHTVINSLACRSAEIHKFPPRDTIMLPPTDCPASIYLPNSPTSAQPAVRMNLRVTYADVLSHGNVLLYLPRCARKRIYTYLLADYPELRNIEIPEIHDFSKAFPEFCHSLDIIYFDTCLLMIQNTTFTISSDGAIFNLMVFLNEFSDRKGYEAVQSLAFAGRTIFGKEESVLGLFEKGEFTSNATELLRRCPNVKSISLILSMEDLSLNFRDGGQALNIMKLTKKVDLASIIKLNQLEIITLTLKPFVALEKTVRSMEETTKIAQLRGFKCSSLEGFWGLKEWFEMQVLNHTRLVEVRCLSLEQLE